MTDPLYSHAHTSTLTYNYSQTLTCAHHSHVHTSTHTLSHTHSLTYTHVRSPLTHMFTHSHPPTPLTLPHQVLRTLPQLLRSSSCRLSARSSRNAPPASAVLQHSDPRHHHAACRGHTPLRGQQCDLVLALGVKQISSRARQAAREQ